jgi:hypothetical protein
MLAVSLLVNCRRPMLHGKLVSRCQARGLTDATCLTLLLLLLLLPALTYVVAKSSFKLGR